MNELYKIIPEFPKYKISNYGNIRNEKKILNQTIIQGGYSSIHLNNEKNKNKKFLVHVLVALSFIPNPENKPTVNHKDHNKLNNNIDNLEWATSKEQNMHRRKSTNGMAGARPVWRIDKKTNEKLEKYISMQLAIEWICKNNPKYIKFIYYNKNNIIINMWRLFKLNSVLLKLQKIYIYNNLVLYKLLLEKNQTQILEEDYIIVEYTNKKNNYQIINKIIEDDWVEINNDNYYLK